MVLQKKYDYKALYPPVLARAEGLRSPRSLLVDASKVTSWTGADGRIQRLVAPGAFAGSTSATGKVRPLPRTLLAAALIATTTVTFAVSPKTARHFVAGDVLSATTPFAVFTLAGTWVATETATVTVAGRSVVVTAADGVLANIAVQIANAINADPILKKIVKAIASGPSVYVHAADMTSTYPISVGETSTSGTFTIGSSLTSLNPTGSVGTVSSVDPVAETITLAATAATGLPVGFPIGVLTSSPADANGEGYGMISPNNPIDLEWDPEDIHGLFVGATVYRDRLPYWDGELSALFPEIYLV